jgi:hypothetical protein
VNPELLQLAESLHLSDQAHRALRYRLGLACANRVRHLLEQPRAVELLDLLQRYVDGGLDEAALTAASDEAAEVANHHRGSTSIDGSKHSAVSATYAVANVLAGRAVAAADYAAYATYATVYGYGGYAVNDPEAFAPEHAWQVAALKDMLRTEAVA